MAIVTASSGNVANASAVATLSPGADRRMSIHGFAVTGSGATAGLPATVTVTGVVGGTMSFTYSFIAGVLVANVPLIVMFPTPIPATAKDTDIVVTCGAGGAGNTNNTVVAIGEF